MKVVKSMLVLLLAASNPLLLAAEHRHHGAHEHGVGKLDFAQEGTVLDIELDGPAMNIVGFEHAPSNEEDRKTLESALARLKDGAALFALPEAASCHLVSADAHTPLVDHEEGNAHHEDEHHDEHEHEETHSDITATWRFDCAHPEALDRVNVRVFEAFPWTVRLQVQFITENHQGAADLNASQPELHF